MSTRTMALVCVLIWTVSCVVEIDPSEDASEAIRTASSTISPYRMCAAGKRQALFLDERAPSAVLTTGASFKVLLTFANCTGQTWIAQAPDGKSHRLGAQAPRDNLTWGRRRVALAEDVPHGHKVTLEFSLAAPVVAGTYTYQWAMLQEGITWFLDRSSPLHNILVINSSVPVPEAVLVGAGDIVRCADGSKSYPDDPRDTGLVVDSIVSLNPRAMVFTAGDVSNDSGEESEYNQCFQRTWGNRLKSKILPAIGNHDIYNKDGRAPGHNYYAYFGNVARGPQANGYYDYTIGPWHVVVLNSNLGNSEKEAEAQASWLQGVLRGSNARRCTLAYWHHPLFSSGPQGDLAGLDDIRAYLRNQIWPLLQDAGAEVIVNGHDHDYEQFLPMTADGTRNDQHGIRQFIVGTGGAGLASVGPGAARKLNSELFIARTYGVLKLTLRATGYSWAFIDRYGKTVRHNGQDVAGSGACH